MEETCMISTYTSKLKQLQIGDLIAKIPIIQGGMGVGISRSHLAGAVAKEGGVGIISTAQIGYDEEGFENDQAGCNLKAIKKHIRKAKELACGNGLVGVNIMVALKHYKEHVRAAVYGFGLSILITAGVGALMYYFCRNSTRRFFAREGMVCVAGSWIAISFFGCLPFVFSREIPNFVDALFEIVSGFTTTGSSILGDVEALSPGIMYWRSFSHWLGGMGVLVFLLALSPNGERGKGYTMHLLRAESPGPNVNKLVPKMRTTARILYVIYMVLTFINFLFLLLGKMPVFDAVCTAFGTAGTGGFGIRNDSIAGYSPYIQNVCTVFMFLFGINFSCYYLLLVRHVKEVLKDQELRLYIIIFVVSILLITFNVRGLCSRYFFEMP